jgi:hypothetical protein
VLSATIVATASQAILTAYLAVTLRRGAKTDARRTLARSLAWLSVYAVFFALTVSSPRGGRLYDTANTLTLGAGIGATFELMALGLWLVRGARTDEPTARRVERRVGAALVVVPIVACLAAIWRGAEGAPWSIVQLGLLTTALLAAVVLFDKARRRGIRGARRLEIACVFPLLTSALNLVGRSGLPLPADTYYLVRDLGLILFAFLLFHAYLEDGFEPMSLRDRLVAGTLTFVLAMATVTSRLLEISGVVHAQAAAERLLVIVVVSSVLVIALVPRLFRRTFLDPLGRLTEGIALAEAGEPVDLPVDREDEIGRVTRSFNEMIAALAVGRSRLKMQVEQLEARRAEVERLNEELRHQVAVRSRELSSVLARTELRHADLGPGARVGDRYVLDALLGRGGMGVVYRARRTTDGQVLAIKVMLGTGSRDDALRFAREAEIAARLDHPNLVGVVDVGVHDGLAYLVMDLISGGSLASAIDRYGDGPWALGVLEQVAAGLVELHARGIVHRDLKPANVLLETGEHGKTIAKISDFGIAHRSAIDAFGSTVAAGPGSAPRTTAGVVLGTVAYMAPELADASDYSPAVDVFALGIIGFEILGVGHPFPVPAVLERLGGRDVRDPPPFGPSVPADVGAILRACLAADPRMRPDAGTVYDTLRRHRETPRASSGGSRASRA